MAKSYDKLAQRLVQILMRFNNAERFTIDELSDEFDVSVRTIQRDINERLCFLPIKKENDYYFLENYALGKLSFDDIKNFATLSGIKSLYPTLSNDFITDILNSKINSAYLIKNHNFEDISSKQKLFEKISATILRKNTISFSYNQKQRVVNPYKLINNTGIWYLLADEDDKLKTFTFSKIENFTCKNEQSFTPNPNFLNQIEDDSHDWFCQEPIEVILKIDNKAKEYFFRKEVLANHKFIEEIQTHFIISTNISYDDEILRVVKYWLPFIRIEKPIYLKEKLNRILKEYIKNNI